MTALSGGSWAPATRQGCHGLSGGRSLGVEQSTAALSPSPSQGPAKCTSLPSKSLAAVVNNSALRKADLVLTRNLSLWETPLAPLSCRHRGASAAAGCSAGASAAPGEAKRQHPPAPLPSPQPSAASAQGPSPLFTALRILLI